MPPSLRSKNRNLYIDLSQLVADYLEVTVLTADVAAAAGSITVRSISGFAVSNVLLIGELGSEEAEIILVHASSAPSGSTITLAANTAKAHSAGTKVYSIKYNQVELSIASTLTGSKSTLTTTGDGDGAASGLITLRGDIRVKAYNEPDNTSGYYFARFKHSISGVFGDYCDGVPYGGHGENTVAYAIDWALRQNRLKTLTDEITLQFCFDEINDCLKEIKGKQLRWPEQQSLNAVLGQTTRGVFIVAMPSDIYSTDDNRSLISVRIGDSRKLSYLDPVEWEEMLDGVVFSKSTGSHAAGATTFNIDNSYDFDDSGSVNVYVSGTKYTLTYTGVTRHASAGALTGVPASGTGAITVTIADDTYAYQGEEEGEPLYYTVRNGNLEIWPIPDSSWDNMNIYGDYWVVATSVNTEGDTLDQIRFDMAKHYLAWAIEAVSKNNGKRDINSGFHLKYRERLNDAIRNKGRGLKYKMKPRVNRISYRNLTTQN